MKLYIYCAGGFGLEAMDLARRVNDVTHQWDAISFIDDVRLEKDVYGASLFTFEEVINTSDEFEVTIANGEPFVRKAIYDKLKKNSVKTATLIDNTAIISRSAAIGDGVTIPAFCFISSLARIESNVTLNAGTLIGHEAVILENCVISSAVNVAGNCLIGKNTYIGMGSQIKQGTKIGEGVIIGMGSVVHSDIPDGVIALGNPARPMKNNSDHRVFNKPSQEG
jgi:sugar O-acyltransferase (sialic acid O-acetyltransferase NeuD family)